MPQIVGSETPEHQTQYDYETFSRLSGDFEPVAEDYTVNYRRMTIGRDGLKALFLILTNVTFELGFLLWLFLPGHVRFFEGELALNIGIFAIAAGIFIVEGLRMFNMLTLCLATLVARNPIPVRPRGFERVAFTTTIVPGKEPFEIVEKTLRAAKKIRYDGQMDVWLLDEGNDPDIKRACRRMGIKHFSRKGKAKWNMPSGGFKAKTKHGNHNAWLAAHGKSYDYVISVDPDHVPLPNFIERLLGYFRDPNVAFVVGPQVYGNYDNLITKGAESQSYLFQAAIQRAGNAYDAPMFVGTNHAYRVKAWESIGGFQDSITEDMLTSLTIHATKNPATGRHWKSVYTPDVLAVGEGPSAWTDFFSQQLRWSRGSNEVFLKNFLSIARRLPWKARLHYSLMIMYYPSVAISWVTGILVSMLYLVMGQVGVKIPSHVWLALYTDVIAAQFVLYAWLRKYNVSPHEAPNSLGMGGVFVSIVTVPIYVTALTSTLLRRAAKFVVTPKGDSSSPDRLVTFQKHFMWAGLVVVFLIYSYASGHNYTGARIWSVLTLVMCMSPVAVWAVSVWPETKDRLRLFGKKMQLALKYEIRVFSKLSSKELIESKELK